VISDRFVDSSLAYQGIARGLGLEEVLALNQVGLQGHMPDRTFLLLVPLDVALRRGSSKPDRIEREGRAFLELVDRAYREVAAAFPERIVTVDATAPVEAVAAAIRAELPDL
jgi:dTMP kinase